MCVYIVQILKHILCFNIRTHIRISFPRNCSLLLSIHDGKSLYCLISGSKVLTSGVSNFPILVSYKFLASKSISFFSEPEFFS